MDQESFEAGFRQARDYATQIVQKAREGVVDQDFRAIKSWIGSLQPNTPPEFEEEED